MVSRKEVSKKIVAAVGLDLTAKTEDRLLTKGRGGFASTHEILGIITEEYWELIEAVKNNDMPGVMRELADIGVACQFGIASQKAGTLDW